MRKFHILILLLYSCLFTTSIFGREHNTDVKKWSVLKPPDKSSKDYEDFFQRANFSEYDWVVTRSDGKLNAHHLGDSESKDPVIPKFDTMVQLQDRNAVASQCLKVEGGWIAAYNQGEFGSAVYWFSQDGKDKKKLSDHQINEFLLEGDRIFAVEGLAHLGMSRGSMIEISKKSSGWSVEEFLPLPASAVAIARIGAGDYAVVTSDMLLRINLKKEILILIPETDWRGLYPNSIQIDDGFIYIGMRQFVIRCKVAKSVENFEFLIPDKSWLNTKTKP